MRTFHCIAMSVAPGGGHNTMYVSQVFPMEISQHAAINGAWATYIKSTYHLQTISTTACQPLSVNSTMQERVLAAEETSWKNQGWEVVHVNWRPGQAGALILGGIALFRVAQPARNRRTACAERSACSGERGRGAQRLLLLLGRSQAHHLFQRRLRHRRPSIQRGVVHRIHQDASAEVRLQGRGDVQNRHHNRQRAKRDARPARRPPRQAIHRHRLDV